LIEESSLWPYHGADEMSKDLSVRQCCCVLSETWSYAPAAVRMAAKAHTMPIQRSNEYLSNKKVTR